MITGDPIVDELIETAQREIKNFIFKSNPSMSNPKHIFVEITENLRNEPNSHIFRDGICRGVACDVCPRRLHCLTREIRICESSGNYKLKFEVNAAISQKQELYVDYDKLIEMITALGFKKINRFDLTDFWQKENCTIKVRDTTSTYRGGELINQVQFLEKK